MEISQNFVAFSEYMNFTTQNSPNIEINIGNLNHQSFSMGQVSSIWDPLIKINALIFWFILQIITNKDLLAINQDSLGIQAKCVKNCCSHQAPFGGIDTSKTCIGFRRSWQVSEIFKFIKKTLISSYCQLFLKYTSISSKKGTKTSQPEVS